MSYKKFDWSKMDSIDVWKAVRTGELKVFPNNYLNKNNCKELIRYLVLDELKLSRDEILKINWKFLSNYQLGGTRKFLWGKIYKALNFCFPEYDIKPWEVTKATPGIWKDPKIRTNFIIWICKKENLNLSNIDDIRKISADLINKYGGSRALREAGGLYELIYPAVDNKLNLKEWQLIKVNFWNKEKTISAVHWLIEEKLKWSHDEVVNNLSASIFYKNDLGGMLSKFCNNSPLCALQIAYPGEYTYLKNIKPKYF